MVFASPIFLFLFLPVVLAAYFALPQRWGNAVLLLASLCFYVWGEGTYAAIVLFSIAFNWIVGRKLGDAPSVSASRRWLAFASPRQPHAARHFQVCQFRGGQNANAALEALHWQPVLLATITLPLGISFFTFQAISYLVDIYRGERAPSGSRCTSRSTSPSSRS